VKIEYNEMIMKYVIALIPQNIDIFIDVAHQLFGPISQEYVLSKNNSLPHITLAQFLSENSEQLQHVWHELQHAAIPRVQFIGIGFTKKWDSKWNASLTVTRTSELIKLQQHIITVVKKYKVESVVPDGDIYRPHLTLARILVSEPVCIDFEKIPLADVGFKLVIGIGDEHGQLIEILFSEQQKRRSV
jgi:2'-5' RNA ligase